MTLSLAFSPCPNDTFVFHALVHGLVPGAPAVDVTYADVDVTNTASLRGRVRPGEGELRGPAVAARPVRAAALRRRARPGLRPARTGRKQPLDVAGRAQRGRARRPDHRVPAHAPVVRPGAAGVGDRGAVRARSCRRSRPAGSTPGWSSTRRASRTRATACASIVDLGEWWETDTGLPIPLGAILARTGAVDPVEAADWVRASVRHAWADPAASRDYVLAHAQEMERAVVDQHIGLYVNELHRGSGRGGLRRGRRPAVPGRRRRPGPPAPRPVRR